MDVSLIIPAHNEQARLAATLEQYSQCLQDRYHADYEIIVVANGCTDQTVQVAQAFAVSHGQVKVIHIPEPIGKGGAVLEGFRQTRGASIVFADADCATSPGSLVHLIDQLADADIVIGSRWLPSSVVIKRQPFLRQIFSRLFNVTIRVLFQLPYRDTQCGAKAFLAAPARTLSRLVKERGWTFDLDLLLWAQFCHFKVKEVPVVWQDQLGSKIRFKSTSHEVLRSLWNLKRRNTWGASSEIQVHSALEKV